MVVVDRLQDPELAQLCLGIPAAQVFGIVQIEPVLIGHGQHFPVIGIHDDRGAHIAPGSRLPLVDVLLHDLLDLHVDGGDHPVPVRSRLDHPL